jgi:hypothetical protein
MNINTSKLEKEINTFAHLAIDEINKLSSSGSNEQANKLTTLLIGVMEVRDKIMLYQNEVTNTNYDE